jgi:hypothetical protein
MIEADTLAGWRFAPGAGDWDDVLRRAGRRRRPTTLVARLALAAAAALLLAVPAFALVGALGGSDPLPGPRLSARFSETDLLELGAPRTFLLRRGGRDGVVPVQLGRLDGTPRLRRGGRIAFVWRLHAGGEVRSVRILDRDGSPVARLCGPCAGDAAGRLVLRPRAAIALFNGRAVAELTAGSTTRRARLVRAGHK